MLFCKPQINFSAFPQQPEACPGQDHGAHQHQQVGLGALALRPGKVILPKLRFEFLYTDVAAEKCVNGIQQGVGPPIPDGGLIRFLGGPLWTGCS